MTRARAMSEKQEQAAGVKLLRLLRAEVYTLGTVRARGDHPGTRQTPGLPDVLCFLPAPPRWGADPQERRLVVWEVKCVGGRVSPEQRRFAEVVRDARIDYVLGTAAELARWLAAEGYIE